MYEAGFYKNVEDGLHIEYSQNGVFYPGGELKAAEHATYNYPVNGWTWFDNEDSARTAFSLPSTSIAASALALLKAYPDIPINIAIQSATTLVTAIPTFIPKQD